MTSISTARHARGLRWAVALALAAATPGFAQTPLASVGLPDDERFCGCATGVIKALGAKHTHPTMPIHSRDPGRRE